MRKIVSFILCMMILTIPTVHVQAEADLPILAPSAILVELSTGKIIYEKNADEKRSPASVTKVMTLLLIFDAIDRGKIRLTDEVMVSEHAASMGGSQVFLEPGETQSVETMIKCICIASANDASVAMAELIAGSEEEFVKQMNQRAKELGMSHTTFVNSNGLDVDGHVTTSKDISKMSRELVLKHPDILQYDKIWMETITHQTKKGTTQFGLTNTNKLLKQYTYTTGLKTGSTGRAGFCISATAKKNDLELVAVIMGAKTSKERNKDAITLLNYGFSKCRKYTDDAPIKKAFVKVERGKERKVRVQRAEKFFYVDTSGKEELMIKRKEIMNHSVKAPVKKGERVGQICYYSNQKLLGKTNIITANDVKEMDLLSSLKNVTCSFLL